MMEGWKEYKLGELVTLQQGFAVNKKSNHHISEIPTNFPLLKISDLLNGTETLYVKDSIPRQFLVDVDEIIYSRTGQVGYAFIGRKGVVYNNCFRVTPINDIDYKYLYCWLNMPQVKYVAQSLATGAAQPDLNHGAFKSIKINLPPLPTQKKIAKILSAYDELIENNLKRIKLLEEMAQKTYEEWFVRMKFPGHETAKFDKETGLPEGWKKIKLGEVCDVSGGGTPSKVVEEYWGNGTITWFSPTDLSKANSYCLLDSSNKITKSGLKKSSAKLMQPNSFMMTSRATIGLFGLIDKPFSTNQGFINVTPKLPEHKYFLFFNFKFRVPEFLNHATGSTFPELSKSKFKFLKIKWPTENILIEFDKNVRPIISIMMILTNQNQRLKEARDILLPRLMTGMIDVDDLDNYNVEKEKSNISLAAEEGVKYKNN